MGKAKDAATLSAHVANSHHAIIAARAEALGMSKSKFVGYIIEAWVNAGCPAVTVADAALQTLKGNTPQSTSANKRRA
jgi:hypothetical protein